MHGLPVTALSLRGLQHQHQIGGTEFGVSLVLSAQGHDKRSGGR
jgi:hypothetical protein